MTSAEALLRRRSEAPEPPPLSARRCSRLSTAAGGGALLALADCTKPFSSSSSPAAHLGALLGQYRSTVTVSTTFSFAPPCLPDPVVLLTLARLSPCAARAVPDMGLG